jgi:hypothetical protein
MGIVLALYEYLDRDGDAVSLLQNPDLLHYLRQPIGNPHHILLLGLKFI